MPPCTMGWSVFTRPSSISGQPVTVSSGVTARPLSFKIFAVPPVEISSVPSSVRARANSTRPSFFVTERRALWTWKREDPGVTIGASV